MRIEIVTNAATLAGLEAAWWDLFARMPAATPFASPAWLLPWWRVFAPGALFVVAVWNDGQLVGLAPLYEEVGEHGRRLLPLGIGFTDSLDILVDPAHAEPVGHALTAAVATAQAGRDRWDCWSAEELADGAAALGLPTPAGWRSTVVRQSACPVLPLSRGGALRDTIPPTRWRKWRMAQNRAARRSCVVVATTPATLAEDLAHLFRLHGARWQARGEAGVLSDASVQAFHAIAAPALLEAGLLRLNMVRIDGVVAGVYYGLQHRGLACAYLGGFDPAFGFESPGTLLIGAAIEAAAQAGATAFSFLRGQEPYKYGWGAVDRWNHRRTFVPVR